MAVVIAAQRSSRANRTRERLVNAAKVVFARDGYVSSRTSDITSEAGAATGSFYNYFKTKEDIFEAVAIELYKELANYHPPVDDRDIVGRIEGGNRNYILMFRKNARLIGVVHGALVDLPNLMKLHHQFRHGFQQRAANLIRRLQSDSLADQELDADLAASVLAGMVYSYCYNAFVLSDRHFSDDVAVKMLTTAWIRTIGLGLSTPNVRAD